MSKEYKAWLRTAAGRYGLPPDSFKSAVNCSVERDDKPMPAGEIEVKLNNLSNKEWCPFCDRFVCIEWGPWPFLRGTYRPVCPDCAAERGVREPYGDHLSGEQRVRWRDSVERLDDVDVPFEKKPMPAWLVAKLSKLRDEGRGKLMLGMALAGGDYYECGFCNGGALGCGLAFMLRERIDPEWSIVCDNCAEFLDPALCRAYDKLMSTPFGKELDNQQSPLWRHVPDLTEALAAQGLAIWDFTYGYIVPAESGEN